MAGQYRHWKCTVWPGHVGLDQDEVDDEILSEHYWRLWEQLGENRDLRFAEGQIERGEKEGNLHMQIYLEWKKSLRLKELTNRFPCNAEHRPKNETREKAREYATKELTRVESLPQLGEWREEEEAPELSYKQLAIRFVLDGRTPAWIARNEPAVYFTHYNNIKALYLEIQESL